MSSSVQPQTSPIDDNEPETAPADGAAAPAADAASPAAGESPAAGGFGFNKGPKVSGAKKEASMKGLATRVRTAALILPPVLFILYWGGAALVVLSMLVFLQINREFYAFTPQFSQYRRIGLVLASALLPAGYLLNGGDGMLVGALIAVLAVGIGEVITVEYERHHTISLQSFGTQALGLIYPGGMGTLLVIIASTRNPSEIAWLMLCVIAADTGAYFAGSMIGGPLLSPRISPKKTVSGAIAGVLFAAIIASIGAGYLLVDIGPVYGAFLGLLLGFLAVIGDLVESLVKRIYEVKDAGGLLPGHGGMLDRVDGLIFALPILFLI